MANAERSGRRRLSLEVLVIGAACLACCLPLLAGIVATPSGALAGFGATLLGAGAGVALAIAIVASAAVLAAALLVRRRARAC